MKRPLVERDDEKKKKKSPVESDSTWKTLLNIVNTPVDRWQIALMKCTSFSQLFVHFYTLGEQILADKNSAANLTALINYIIVIAESSVEWSRSVLNARCRVCRRKGDHEKMLLCDTCNKGHHIYCLKPPMEVSDFCQFICSCNRRLI